jgi:hypothetical protein
MLNVTKELTALARKLGYTGKAPDTVAKAINAIASVAGEGSGSGGGCDCEPGYEVVKMPLFSETATTQLDENSEYSGLLSYTQPIESNTITVTFNGTDYVCNRVDAFGSRFYGGFNEQGPDFTDCPFFIVSMADKNMLYTEAAGTYAVAVVADAIQVSPNFSAAVKASGCGCYTVTKEQLFSGTVETVRIDPYSSPEALLPSILDTDMDTITVTFDGVDYTCTKRTTIEDDTVAYSYSLPDSPFMIVSVLGGSMPRNIVITPEEGQHTVAIKADMVEPSANYQAAANNCLLNTMPLKCVEGTSYDVMREATLRGQLMYFHTTNGFFFIANCPGPDSIADNNEVTIFPESNDAVARIDTNRLHISDANDSI